MERINIVSSNDGRFSATCWLAIGIVISGRCFHFMAITMRGQQPCEKLFSLIRDERHDSKIEELYVFQMHNWQSRSRYMTTSTRDSNYVGIWGP